MVEKKVRQRAWGWISHMLERLEGLAKSALGCNPQGKRKGGRPQHTWRCTRIAELEGGQLTWQEVNCTAQKRW